MGMNRGGHELIERLRGILRLHHDWRKRTGWAGPDEYHPDRALRHPMTVAAYGRGYALLSAMPGGEGYCQPLEEACRLLVQDRNLTGRFRHACWGLPFAWHDNPDHFPYLITTSLAGLCFVEAYGATRERRWLDEAIDAGRWIVGEAGHDAVAPGRICFHYAPSPELRIRIHNVNAMAGGFLARLAEASGIDRFGDLADQAMAFETSTIRPDGSWPYQDGNPKGPESHTGYILEGMAQYMLARPQRASAMRPLLEHGAKYYRLHQYVGPRALHERDDVSRTEARLWAHGWGIGAFSLVHRCSGSHGFLRHACSAAEWSLQHLIKPSGAFRQRSDDDAEFLRQAGHMFYGLAYLTRELWSVQKVPT